MISDSSRLSWNLVGSSNILTSPPKTSFSSSLPVSISLCWVFVKWISKVWRCFKKLFRILPDYLGFFGIHLDSFEFFRIDWYSLGFFPTFPDSLRFPCTLTYRLLFFRIFWIHTDFSVFARIFSSFLGFFRNLFNSLSIISILSTLSTYFRILSDSLGFF